MSVICGFFLLMVFFLISHKCFTFGSVFLNRTHRQINSVFVIVRSFINYVNGLFLNFRRDRDRLCLVIGNICRVDKDPLSFFIFTVQTDNYDSVFLYYENLKKVDTHR